MSALTRLGGEFLLWLLLLYRVNTVTCQGKIEGFIGDTVLLPCIYREVHLLPDPVTVFWRDQNDLSVLDIMKNVPDNSTQNQKFKGRVSSFPEFYKKGNFSIIMKNVQQSDSGPYECHIPKVDFQLHISLSVSDKRVEAATPPPGPSDGAAVTPNMVLLLLPLSLLLSSFH